jgi:hypothetical protein
MTRSLTGLVLVLAAAVVSATGCYTVLRAPGGFSRSEAPAYSTAWEAPEESGPRLGRFSNERDLDTPAYDSYGSGFPIFGYDSRHGMYGFGSPFAYGPGYGPGYGYGYGSRYGYDPYGYSPRYGPYGYGYDPYYSGNTYVPPGYELVTSTELDRLRAGLSSGGGPTSDSPPVDSSALQPQQRQAQERAWTQRVEPTARRSTVGQRTTRTSSGSPSSGKVSSSGSSKKPASSDEESSGSSAAKRRKQRR